VARQVESATSFLRRSLELFLLKSRAPQWKCEFATSRERLDLGYRMIVVRDAVCRHGTAGYAGIWVTTFD
jgi:hypothetical protein